MITLQTLRDLTLSIGAAALAALAVDELTDNALRRTTPLPMTPHGWLYTPRSYGQGVRRLRPATAAEDAASAQSWADGNGGWIALGASGEISSLSDPRVLAHATRPGQGDVVYVSDRPALDPGPVTLGALFERLTGQAATLIRQRTTLASITLAARWHGQAAHLPVQARGPILRDALADDTTAAESEDVRLTADVVALAQRDGQTHVLLIRRGWDPYAGRWALPGGHIDPGETAEAAARRKLAEETGIHAGDLRLIGVYDTPGRDPHGPYITSAYLAERDTMPTPTADTDADAALWVPVDQALAHGLAFDHAAILRDALALAGEVDDWHDEIAASHTAAYEDASLAPLTVDELLDEADQILVQGQQADTELAATAATGDDTAV